MKNATRIHIELKISEVFNKFQKYSTNFRSIQQNSNRISGSEVRIKNLNKNTLKIQFCKKMAFQKERLNIILTERYYFLIASMKVEKKKRGGRNFISGLNRTKGEKVFHSYLVQSLWFQTLDPDKKIHGIVTVSFDIEKECLQPFVHFINEEKMKKLILMNCDYFIYFKDFYEEECHLTILNWVYKERDYLKNYIKYDIYHINLILDILNTILNIYKKLNIKSIDLIELKLYDKLKKISLYEIFESYDYAKPIFNNIKLILKNWDKIIVDKEIKLNKKRKKDFISDKEETEEDSDHNSKNNKNNLINNIKNILEKIKKNKIKKNIKFDLTKNKIIYFNKLDSPSILTHSKDQYDPLSLI